MKATFLIFLIAMACLLAGCTTVYPPQYRAEAFEPERMDVIHLMPVVDARVVAELQTPFNKIIQDNATSLLKRKRYTVEKLADPSYAMGLTLDDIVEENPDFIRGIGPQEAQWVMVFVLEDLSRKVSFGSSANAEVRMVILDKQQAAVVWRDKAVIRAGQGGLIGMMMTGAMDDQVLILATQALIQNKLPKRPKPE